MNKNVKRAISQTKGYACSSEFGKDFAKNVAISGIGLILATFVWNVIDNYIDEIK